MWVYGLMVLSHCICSFLWQSHTDYDDDNNDNRMWSDRHAEVGRTSCRTSGILKFLVTLNYYNNSKTRKINNNITSLGTERAECKFAVKDRKNMLVTIFYYVNIFKNYKVIYLITF